MEQIKRFICLVLCLAMLIGYVPVSSHAEDLSQQGLCEHHPEHVDCSYAAAVTASDCTHKHGDDCYIQKCVHIHGGCGYAAAVDGVACDHQHDELCGYTAAVAEGICTCTPVEAVHMEDCAYTPAVPEGICNHVHGTYSFVEAREEIPCGHDCTADPACSENVLNCWHEHDEECGYAEARDAVVCDFVCEECDVAAMTVETVAEHRYGTVYAPYTHTNDASVPYSLVDGVYYSANHTKNSVSTYTIAANFNTTISFNYGVSSESGCDEFTLEYNGTQLFCISGLDSGKMTLDLAQGDVLVFTYEKDDSESERDDQGWFEITSGDNYLNEELTTPNCRGDVCCLDCGEVLYDRLPHNIVTMPAVVPTCTTEGKTEGRICAECGFVSVAQESVPMAAHSFVDGVCTICESVTYSEGITFERSDDGTFYIVSGIGTFAGESLVIPQIYNRLPVQEIGASAFADCASITRVTIPSSIKTIGDKAFYNCTGLKGVYISDLKAWCNISFAFEREWDEGLWIESYANPLKYACNLYLNGEKVTDLVLSYAPKAFAFYNCSLNSVVFTGQVGLNTGVFRGSSLKELSIPGGPSYLQPYALHECRSIAGAFYLPASVTEVGDWNFWGPSIKVMYLGGSEIPDRCDDLDYGNTGPFSGSDANVVYDCQLVQADGNDYIIKDGEAWFIRCPQTRTGTVEILPQVTYGGQTYNVTKIGDYAFYNCRSLQTIRFASDAPGIAQTAFSGVTATAEYPAGNATWTADGMQTYGGTITWESYGDTHVHEFDDNGQCTCGVVGGTFGANLVWALDDAGTLTISGNGAMPNYTDVIQAPWYSYAKTVEKLVVKEGITSLSNCGFENPANLGFVNLTEVVLPSSLQSIGSECFQYCRNIKEIRIPEQVTSIGIFAFEYCEGLESFVFPAGMTGIPQGGFNHCSNLKSVTIPATITTVSYGAFDGCTALTDVYYGSNEKNWNNISFGDYNDRLLNATIHYTDLCVEGHTVEIDAGFEATCTKDGLTEGSHCSVCDKIILAQEVIPAGHTVENGICIKCESYGTCGENLTWTFDESTDTLTISGSGDMFDYNTIGGSPWHSRSNEIKKVVIEDGVASIGILSFNACVQLSSITLPESLTRIGGGAFDSCISLSSITLPQSLTSIGNGAFACCIELSSITIPEGVTYIDQYTFEGCTKLSSITIPDSVTDIGLSAFWDCSSLSSIVFPRELTHISQYAFWDCAELKDIYFTGNCPEIEVDAFTGVTATTYYPANNETWTSDVMQNYGGTITWVPVDPQPTFPMTGTVTTLLNVRSAPSYDSDIVEKLEAGTQVEILRIETVDGIDWGLIDTGWIMMHYVDLGNGSGSVDNTCGKNLVWNFDKETGVLTISGTGAMTDFIVKDPGPGYAAKTADSPWLALEDAVQQIVIEEGVTTIGTGAFADFDNLTSVSLPDSLQSIGDYAFFSDELLTDLVIPDGVTYLGDYALCICVNLPAVTLPSGITRIGESTLDQCLALENLVIPASVSSIGGRGLAYCTNLREVVFEGSAPTFDDTAFHGSTFTAYYRQEDSSWTASVQQNYGGTITWSPIAQTYAVLLDAQGGVIYDGITEYTAGTVTPLPTNVVQPGYVFLGWYEGDTRVTEIPADAIGDKTYVAKWQEKASVSIDTTTQAYAYDGTGKAFILKDTDGNLLSVATGNDWLVPCSYTAITTPFGYRENPENGASTYHQGIDLDTGTGWPVVASRAGTVVTAGWGSSAGNYVQINHGDGFSSIYMHLSSIGVSAGQHVSAGQYIGATGNTGVASDDHLHFGISLNGVYVNPVDYVNLDGNDGKFYIDYTYSGAELNEDGLPYNPGIYGIRVTRPETATHKAVDLVIKPAVRIVALSGSCGYNLYWEFEPDTGVLTISGNGSMYSYSEEEPAPWHVYSSEIRKIQLDGESLSIGEYAFTNCIGLTSITIPDNVYRIGDSAFYGCIALNTITFSGGSRSIMENAFSGVTATAYYPAGWGWTESRLKDYGGKITWIETGEIAKKLAVSMPQSMLIGTKDGIFVDVRPWNATGDCVISIGDPNVLEMISREGTRFEVLAVGEGTTTVTITERKSGLQYSGEILVVEPEEITVPCAMELKVPEGDSLRYFSFAPETTGTYCFTVTNIEHMTLSNGGYGDGIFILENGEWMDAVYNADASMQSVSAVLNAGNPYIIGVPFYLSAYEQIAQFTAEDVSDGPTRTFLHFYQDQEEISFMPGADESVYLHVNYNGTGSLAWSCSDSSVLEIMEIHEESNECRFRAVSEGTAMITVSDGVLSASISITTKMVECLELYLPVTEIQEKEYYYKRFAFVAPEDGRYAFSATAEGGIPTISFNSWSSEANILFGYGENSSTAFRTMKAGEICVFDVYGHLTSCTVRVSKATAKPLSMKVITKERYGGSITFGASFAPGNACDRIVKWEINNRDIASETNNPDRYTNDRNEMTYETYGEGTFTVTATSESGLKASLTVTVSGENCGNGHVYGEWIHLQDASGNETGRERRTCVYCGAYQERRIPPLDEAAEKRVVIDAAILAGQSTVWIDGVEYALQKYGDKCYVDLPDSEARTLITYTYGASGQSKYPVGMKVWMLENIDGIYTVTRTEVFDNILQYSGMSIRVTGKKGIRMITSMEQAKKNALVSGGLEGYRLKEYGTVVAWASKLTDGNPLVLGQSYALSNYAYKKGVADPVFAYSGSLMQYTNVLVNFTEEQCKNELALRPYMILEDENGETVTIYGGIVYRSIGYIAYQNRDAFEPQTAEYNYIWDIIHYVYGDVYDDEFIHAWTPSIK